MGVEGVPESSFGGNTSRGEMTLYERSIERVCVNVCSGNRKHAFAHLVPRGLLEHVLDTTCDVGFAHRTTITGDRGTEHAQTV